MCVVAVYHSDQESLSVRWAQTWQEELCGALTVGGGKIGSGALAVVTWRREEHTMHAQQWEDWSNE